MTNCATNYAPDQVDTWCCSSPLVAKWVGGGDGHAIFMLARVGGFEPRLDVLAVTLVQHAAWIHSNEQTGAFGLKVALPTGCCGFLASV